MQWHRCAAQTGKGVAHLQLLVCHILAQLLGNALEVLERDLAGLVIVKEPERLQARTTALVTTYILYWPKLPTCSTETLQGIALGLQHLLPSACMRAL